MVRYVIYACFMDYPGLPQSSLNAHRCFVGTVDSIPSGALDLPRFRGIPSRKWYGLRESHCPIYLSGHIDQNRCTLLLQVRMYTIYMVERKVRVLVMYISQWCVRSCPFGNAVWLLSIGEGYTQPDFTSLRPS